MYAFFCSILMLFGLTALAQAQTTEKDTLMIDWDKFFSEDPQYSGQDKLINDWLNKENFKNFNSNFLPVDYELYFKYGRKATDNFELNDRKYVKDHFGLPNPKSTIDDKLEKFQDEVTSTLQPILSNEIHKVLSPTEKLGQRRMELISLINNYLYNVKPSPQKPNPLDAYRMAVQQMKAKYYDFSENNHFYKAEFQRTVLRNELYLESIQKPKNTHDEELSSAETFKRKVYETLIRWMNEDIRDYASRPENKDNLEIYAFNGINSVTMKWNDFTEFDPKNFSFKNLINGFGEKSISGISELISPNGKPFRYVYFRLQKENISSQITMDSFARKFFLERFEFNRGKIVDERERSLSTTDVDLLISEKLYYFLSSMDYILRYNKENQLKFLKGIINNLQVKNILTLDYFIKFTTRNRSGDHFESLRTIRLYGYLKSPKYWADISKKATQDNKPSIFEVVKQQAENYFARYPEFLKRFEADRISGSSDSNNLRLVESRKTVENSSEESQEELKKQKFFSIKSANYYGNKVEYFDLADLSYFDPESQKNGLSLVKRFVSKPDISIKTEPLILDANGLHPLIKPRHSEILSLKAIEVQTGKEFKNYKIIQDSWTRDYAIQISSQDSKKLELHIDYKLYSAPKQSVAVNANTHRLQKIINNLNEIGATVLATEIQSALSKNQNLSVHELSYLISENSLYSFDTAKNQSTDRSANIFSGLEPFVNENGIFCFQCNGAADLMSRILRFAYHDERNIEFKILTTFNDKHGDWFSAIRHAQIGYYVDRKLIAVFDPTPYRKEILEKVTFKETYIKSEQKRTWDKIKASETLDKLRSNLVLNDALKEFLKHSKDQTHPALQANRLAMLIARFFKDQLTASDLLLEFKKYLITNESKNDDQKTKESLVKLIEQKIKSTKELIKQIQNTKMSTAKQSAVNDLFLLENALKLFESTLMVVQGSPETLWPAGSCHSVFNLAQ